MVIKKYDREYVAEDCGEIQPQYTTRANKRTDSVKTEDCGEIKQSTTPNDSILTALKQYIDNNKVTGLEMKEPEDALIFAPYSSFQKSPKWTVGRYIGEMVVNLPKENIKNARKDQTIRLSIHPRFGTKFLIHMIEEIYSFRILQSTKRQDKGNTWNNIYQLILRQLWVAKFAKADKYGLPRKTVKRIHQGMQIHGHLNVRKSLVPFFTKKHVVSEYREKEVDDVIGRIVYKAYDILADKETGLTGLPPQVQESINDLYTRYHKQQIKVFDHEYLNIRYKSIYLSWKPLVDFSWQIIKHKGFNPEKNIEGNGYAMFFDMAEIWEAYIGKVLETDFFHCTQQNSNIKLFKNEQEKEFQRIIPDYISSDWTNEKAKAIGDAKYMDLVSKTNLLGEQTYSVYYKTIMYMYRFNAKKGFIFYPKKTSDTGNAIKTFTIGGENKGALYMIGLNIPQNNGDMDYKDFQNKIKEKEELFRSQVKQCLLNVHGM